MAAASPQSADRQVDGRQSRRSIALPLSDIETLLLQGRSAEARAAAQQALRLYRERSDRHGEATCLLLLGDAEIEARDFGSAAANLAEGAAILASLGDRFGSWAGLWMLALVETRRDQLEPAIAHHQRSLALLREIAASDAPFSAGALGWLGNLFSVPEKIRHCPPSHAETCKAILLRITEALSRKSYMQALMETEKLAAAEVELPRITALSNQLEGIFDAEAALLLGDLRRRQWRLDEAREGFLQALRAAQNERTALAALANLAETEVASGRPERALAWNDDALARLRRRSEISPEVIGLLESRALILEACGRLDAAEAAFGEALALALRAGDIDWQASIQKDLGLLAMRVGRHDKAVAHLEKAVRLLQAVDDPATAASAWLFLSLAYSNLEAWDNAASAIEQARMLARRSESTETEAMVEVVAVMARSQPGIDDDLGAIEKAWATYLDSPRTRAVKRRADLRALQSGFSILLGMFRSGAPPSSPRGDELTPTASFPGFWSLILGAVHFRRGETDKARDLWLKAMDESPRKDLELLLLAGLGAAYRREGKAEEAIRYLVRAVGDVEHTVEGLRVEELLASYLGGQQQSFHDLIELLIEQGRPQEAFAFAERARARAFLQGLGNGPLAPPRDADPHLVEEAEALRAQILDLERRALTARPDERQRLASELEQARQRYWSLKIRLKVSDPEPPALVAAEPLSVQAVRDELSPETTLISYFVASSGRVHAWVLDRESFSSIPLSLGPQDLRRAVCWAEEIGRGVGPQTSGRGAQRLDPRCGGQSASSEAIYWQLIAPLAGKIRHSRIVLVPHGDLHYLPFAALRNPQTGRTLIEDYTLTYAPSASALHLLRSKETPVAGRSLVLGDPELAAPGRPGLPAAAREATAVARLLGTEPLLGPRATEGVLYDLKGQVDLLHIAAHGTYEPASPLFSRIALAPSEGYDGNLEVHEIQSGLDLAGVNLVVLSACRTATGERSSGDDVVGLTRAFLYAGSPGVISTLWDIDDDAAAVLMEAFYRRLLADASAAEALRQAQLAMLRDPRYRDPYFWAAFSLTGDPQGRWQGTVPAVDPPAATVAPERPR